jgi:CheY-like chemotaxis protein
MNKAPVTGGRIAVLVVDDEPMVRAITAAMLMEAGFKVEEATNSDEALKKLHQGAYPLDALVTDVQMPGAMNGYALAKRVRELFPDAAIIVISGAATPLPGDMPPQATFLAKPVRREVLIQAMDEALRPV